MADLKNYATIHKDCGECNDWHWFICINGGNEGCGIEVEFKDAVKAIQKRLFEKGIASFD